MVLACRPAPSAELISYTYDGPIGAILDVQVARRVAAAAGLSHEVLRLGPDFFNDFQTHADRTVFVTDGYYGPLGAHELYLSSRARKLAPIRLTGVFGGEVLRGVGTLKPHRLGAGLLDPVFEREAHASCETRREPLHPVSSAVFGDTPAALHGSLKACRTELRFRTPFLDNTLVKLAYRAPAQARSASDEAVRLVAAASPQLARMPTDRGHSLGGEGLRLKLVRRLMAEATFKLDYWVNDGMPNWLVKADPLLDYLHSPVGLLGRHKYLRYRRWLRRELAGYLQERLDAAAKLPFFDRRGIERLGVEHLSGRRNRAQDIGTVLTIEATYRLLLRR
jgi:asparagine synthase (glutamine-hydrolysing)